MGSNTSQRLASSSEKKGIKFWGQSWFYFFGGGGWWEWGGIYCWRIQNSSELTDMESPTKEIEEFESTALKYLQPEQIEKIWLRLRGL